MKNTLLILAFFFSASFVFAQKDTVEVNGMIGNYTIKKGTIVAYTGSHHASVGISFEIDADSEYLEFIKSEMTYEQDQETAGNGGDAAWVTYYYKVIKEGKTNLHIRKDFRGDTESETNIRLTLIK